MKIHNNIINLIINKKIYVCLLICLSIGVILMLAGKKTDYIDTVTTSVVMSEDDNIPESISNENTEYNLIEILKQVEGVGEIDIMINYSATSEKVPLTEVNGEQEEVVYITEGSKTEPYIITETNPRIEGVVIVAQGAGNLNIYSSLQDTVSSVLGIPIHKVKILKMK